MTQFYKLALDNAAAVLQRARRHAGQRQPDGAVADAQRERHLATPTGSITYGADGYAIAVDPTDPDTVYLEWQEGNLLRYDRKSHETVYISPKPGAGDPPLRFNWDSPVIVSPHAHTRIYYASQYVWRSDDRGDSWKQISPDLTRNIFRLDAADHGPHVERRRAVGPRRDVDVLDDHDASASRRSSKA